MQSGLCRQFLTLIPPHGGGSAPGKLRALKGDVADLSGPCALNERQHVRPE
jgi:hypothetical protein